MNASAEEQTFIARTAYGYATSEAWIEYRQRPDDDYDLIGMGRSTWRDQMGGVVREKTGPSGLVGWAPRCAVDKPAPSFFQRFMEWLL